MNFIEAMKIAEGVLAKYKIDQLKWWKRLDGTPMLNDLAVRFSEAFMEAATEKKNAAQRCKVGSICTPETCTCALIDDEPNVSVSTNQPVQAKALTDERAAFEQWCVRKGYSTNKWHGDGSVYVDGYTLSCWEAWQARALLASQPSAQADVAAVRDAALEEGIEKAAKLIEQKVQDYVDDHGIYDRDTGAVEFPGDGEIYVGEMTELAEDIRALKSAAPTAQPQADGVDK